MMNQGTNFLTDLKEEMEEEGYLSPVISQIFDTLEQNSHVPSESKADFLAKQINFSLSKKQDPLQHLYLLAGLTKDSTLSPETLNALAVRVLELLQSYYGSELSFSDYDINTRLLGWKTLQNWQSSLDEKIQVEIKQLAIEVLQRVSEEEAIKNIISSV